MPKVLYLGLVPPQESYLHYPVIAVEPRGLQDPFVKEALRDLFLYTHFIFTSKSAVSAFFALIDVEAKLQIANCCFIVVGKVTAEALREHGIAASYIAKEEQAEGVVDVLNHLDLTGGYLFWPHSSLARPVISCHLKERGVKYCDTVFYETCIREPQGPKPSLEEIREIIFTSPSTVEGFCRIFGILPADIKITAIGPITRQALMDTISKSPSQKEG